MVSSEIAQLGTETSLKVENCIVLTEIFCSSVKLCLLLSNDFALIVESHRAQSCISLLIDVKVTQKYGTGVSPLYTHFDKLYYTVATQLTSGIRNFRGKVLKTGLQEFNTWSLSGRKRKISQ